MTFAEAVRALAARIAQRPHADGQREERALVEHVTGVDAGGQLAKANTALDDADWQRLEALVKRREAGEPLARLVGRAAFWDFEVGVNEATLIPRDDTGTLVEAALKVLPEDRPVSVADLGTGTGIILLALARERPQLEGVGIDVSEGAVEQAYRNAKALGLTERLQFFTGSWLEGVDRRFDMIVSNPPYIRADAMAGLAEEVRLHDPHRALVAGEDGLDAYRALLPSALSHLNKDGHVLVEIGYDQADSVAELARQAGFQNVALHHDLGGQARVLHLQQRG
ncbi:MAG: peptide chain release factor N(5)-glutamine methyltransferase [Pseudomonadota bacterium]